MKRKVIITSALLLALAGSITAQAVQGNNTERVSKATTSTAKSVVDSQPVENTPETIEQTESPLQAPVEQAPALQPVQAEVPIAAPQISPTEQMVRDMATKHGVDPDTLVSYATCTSNMNPQNTYTNGRGEQGMGLFGFSAEDFAYFRAKHHVTGPSPYDVEYQSFMAAKLLAGGDTWIFCK